MSSLYIYIYKQRSRPKHRQNLGLEFYLVLEGLRNIFSVTVVLVDFNMPSRVSSICTLLLLQQHMN